MWLNSLRLASPEHAEEGKAGGQSAQPAEITLPEFKDPTSAVIEDTSETLTPKQQVSEVAEKTPTLGEHASDRSLNAC